MLGNDAGSGEAGLHSRDSEASQAEARGFRRFNAVVESERRQAYLRSLRAQEVNQANQVEREWKRVSVYFASRQEGE